MRGYVPTRWGQLHYSATGEATSGDQPTIVLLHETPLNHGAFGRLAPLLSQRFKVVVFDTPGYGQSDGPGQPTAMEEYAKTVVEGIDALGLNRVVLYGIHTGGSLALQIAIDLGERAAGLVLSGLPYYSDEVREARRVRQVPLVTEDGSHLLDTFAWEPAVYDAELRSRLVIGVQRDPVNGYLAFHAVYGYQPARWLSQVSCPALTLSHPMDPLFDCDVRFVERVPQARQVVLEAERLPVYWTVPEAVAREISAFVTSSS